MSDPTAADPHRIELCWTPDQNFGRVSVFPSRAPVWSILGLLRAGEALEAVAAEFPGVAPDQVRLLGRLAADLAEMEHARPRLVVVCGSIADEDRLLTAALWYRRPGTVVHIPRAEAALTKAERDREHREWIDLADEVVVVRKPDGSIGESTTAEVAYARERGKPVRWWPPEASE